MPTFRRNPQAGLNKKAERAKKSAFERFTDALEQHGREIVHGSDESQYMAQCPAHADGRPSLHVSNSPEGVLLFCFAYCSYREIAKALELGVDELFEAEVLYHYRDADGNVVKTVRRTVGPDGKKIIKPVSGDTKAFLLYQLPEVIAAVKAGKEIHVVEGEKDVHAVERAGGVGTTTGAVTTWSKADTSHLHGAKIVVVVDRDPAGEKWALRITADLAGKADVVLKQAKVGKDFSDHLAAGHGLKDLVAYGAEEDPAETNGKRSVITWAKDIKAKPVSWAWEERIPHGSLSVAAGREATGKSSFGIWLAARISCGELPGDFLGQPKRVFYVAIEDSWEHTIVPRLIAASADLSRIGRFDVTSDEGENVTLSLPVDNEMLRSAVVEHDVALVVIDPLMSVISNTIDSHREHEVRFALDPLAKMAAETDSIIFGIAHFNKSNGHDAASLITGSGAFKNVPRTVFGFARDRHSNERVMTQVKNSLGDDDLPSLNYHLETSFVGTDEGPAKTSMLVMDGESERSVSDVLADNQRDPDLVAEAHDAASWIAAYLEAHGGQAPAKDVISEAVKDGLKAKTIQNARKKVASWKREGFGGKGEIVWILLHRSRIGPDRQKAGTYGTNGNTERSIDPIHPIDHALSENGTNGRPRPRPRKRTDPLLKTGTHPISQ
jgi:5S rRNA maturation endonuclease (ribonuclease M5)